MSGVLQLATGARSLCECSKDGGGQITEVYHWGIKKVRGLYPQTPFPHQSAVQWVPMGQTPCYLDNIYYLTKTLQFRGILALFYRLGIGDAERLTHLLKIISLISSWERLWVQSCLFLSRVQCHKSHSTSILQTPGTPSGVTQTERCLRVSSLSPCKENILRQLPRLF